MKADTLVLESNFDDELLNKDEKRPWSIKQRIKGRHGHLSNKVTFEFLNEILKTSKIKTLFLAHLSKDCNSVNHVLNYVQLLKKRYSFLDIHVIDPELELTLTSKN